MMIKVTKSELEILPILWQLESGTVREVHDIIVNKKKVGYTTTLKIMQLMVEKELLVRDTSTNSHIYKSLVKEENVQTSMLNDFIQGAFRGNTKNMVLQALGNHKLSDAEIKEIRKFISQMNKKK